MLNGSPFIERPTAAAVIFFADGLAQGVLRRMLAAGELPNIDSIFARGGVEVRNAIVSLPSLTYANATSLITGMFPGHHGILGNQWFDPGTLDYRDYGSPLTYRNVNHDIRHPTIYELLDDQFTLNVQCHTRKGVKHTIDQDISSGILWALGWYEAVDRRVGDVLARVERVIRRVDRWPIVWMNYFPGLDEIGHRCGPDSSQYARAVRNIDRQIGRIAAFAETKSGCEKLYRVLVTDHGMTGTAPARSGDAISELGAAGWKVSRSANGGRLANCDVLALIGTDRCLRLHLRGETGWGQPASDARTQQFCETVQNRLPHDCLLAYRRREGNQVVVRTKHGTAIIERNGNDRAIQFRYCVTSGSDPLAYAAAIRPGLDHDSWRDARSWLAHSAAAEMPDFVPQVMSMFDSPRSGDVVCFARDDWSFDARFVAGHGSCAASDMRVSHFYAGPGIPSGGAIDSARLVDVMPTVLDLLGMSERLGRVASIDGISIRDLLEHAAVGPVKDSDFGSRYTESEESQSRPSCE